MRRHFPIFNDGIFINFAGVAPVSAPVKDAVIRWAEIGSISDFNYLDVINAAKCLYQILLGVSVNGIFFTRNTTQGIQIFIHNYPWRQNDSVVISDCEFPANRLPWLGLINQGVDVRVHRTNNFIIDIDQFISICDESTKVVSISFVQYLSGQRVDLMKLGKFCRKKDILLVVDAIQGLGVVPIDVEEIGIDWLSADGHKWLCGPEGAGIGWASQRAMDIVKPSSKGWLAVTNPFNFEQFDCDLAQNGNMYLDGSLNIIGIMGLNASIQMLLDIGIENIYNKVSLLTDYAIRIINEQGYLLLTPQNASDRGGIVTFKPKIDPIIVFENLKTHNITCSVRGGYLRISPHYANDINDVDKIFEIIKKMEGG
jgi:selenocysteine lyase/cysteine desulfurase